MSRAWMLFLALGVVLPASSPAQDLVDPTRPPDFSAVARPDGSASDLLKLTSILFSPTRRSAVINGARVVEGDRVGQAEVIRIERDAVILSQPEGPVSLSFSGFRVKHSAINERVTDR